MHKCIESVDYPLFLLSRVKVAEIPRLRTVLVAVLISWLTRLQLVFRLPYASHDQHLFFVRASRIHFTRADVCVRRPCRRTCFFR